MLPAMCADNDCEYALTCVVISTFPFGLIPELCVQWDLLCSCGGYERLRRCSVPNASFFYTQCQPVVDLCVAVVCPCRWYLLSTIYFSLSFKQGSRVSQKCVRTKPVADLAILPDVRNSPEVIDLRVITICPYRMTVVWYTYYNTSPLTRVIHVIVFTRSYTYFHILDAA